jgi:hypothetical protein
MLFSRSQLTATVQSAREAIAVAEPLARWHVPSAQVSSVSMHLDTASRAIASADVGVFAYRHRLFGGTRLWAGFVSIDNSAGHAEFRAGGEYGAEQFAQLSAVPGSGFPPEPIDPNAIAMEVDEVLGLAAERLPLQGAAFQPGGALQLLLRRVTGRYQWHLQHEQARGLGVYTLVVDASTREITYERLPPNFS